MGLRYVKADISGPDTTVCAGLAQSPAFQVAVPNEPNCMLAVTPVAARSEVDTAVPAAGAEATLSPMLFHVLAVMSARPDRIANFALPSGQRFLTTNWKFAMSDTSA